MARIPPKLQAKRIQKPPTLAERKTSKTPPQLTPPQQEQFQTYQNQLKRQQEGVAYVKNKIQVEKQYQADRTQELKDIIARGQAGDYDISNQVRNAQERIRESQARLKALNEALNIAKKGIVSPTSVENYVASSQRFDMVGRRRALEFEKLQAEPEPVYEFKTKEVPRTVVTTKGTFEEFASGTRVKVSEETIPRPGKVKQYRQPLLPTPEELRGKPPTTSTQIQKSPVFNIEKPKSEVQPTTLTRREQVVAYTSTKRARGEVSILGEISSFEAGIYSSVASTLQLGKQAISDPLGTAGGIITSIPEIPKAGAKAIAIAESEPSYAAGYIVGELGQSYLVGKGISAFKSSKMAGKISNALDEAKVETKSVGSLTEDKLSKFARNSDEVIEFKKIIDEGYSTKVYEVKLKPKTGLEASTPKVKGYYVEVFDQQGNLIRRVSLGKVEAKFKGKTIEEPQYIEAIQKINKESGGVEGYIRVTRGQPSIFKKPGEFKKTQIDLYQKGRTTSFKEKAGVRIAESETETSLLLGKRGKGATSLIEESGLSKESSNILFDIGRTKDKKPISKTKAIEVQVPRTIDIDVVTPTGESGLIRVKTGYSTFGISETTPIKTKSKFKKPSKSWQLPEEKVKPTTEPKPPKTYKGDAQDLIYIRGETFKPSPSIQQQRIIAETGFFQFTQDLPTQFANKFYSGGVAGGFGFGLFSGIKSSTGLIDRSQGNLLVDNENKFKEKNVSNLSNVLVKEGVKPDEDTRIIDTTVQFQPSRTVQKEGIRLGMKPVAKMTTTPNITPGSSFFIGEKPLIPKKYKLPLVEGERYVKEQGYNAYGYVEATKKKKAHWKKLNNQPLTKKSALGLSGRYVDTTISARGKVIKVKPRIKKGKKIKREVLDTKDNYWTNNQYKFRTFKQKKGVRTKLPNSFIEKQKYRLDHPIEKRMIKGARRTPFGF